MKVDKLITNGTIVTHTGRFNGVVGVKDEKIAFIGESAFGIEADEVIDISGKYLMPGLIDGHAHFFDPGMTDREDFEHGTAACAAGGITMPISHPLNLPPALDVETFEYTVQCYEGRSITDYGVDGGGSSETYEKVDDLWNKTGAACVKMFMCFSIKEFPFVRDDAMMAVLERLAKYDGLAIVHCENHDIITHMEKRLRAEGRNDYRAFNESHPEYSEVEAVERLIFYLEQTGARALVCHVSSAKCLKIIKDARERGVHIYAESCPHFFTFTYEDMDWGGPYLKFTPVMRDAANRDEMWKLLDSGYVHTLGSDHSAFDPKDKEAGVKCIWDAPNGLPGFEVMLPNMLNGVNSGLTSLERIVEVTSYNPANLYGFYPKKGCMAIGSDADFVVVDMDMEKIYTDADRKSKCPYSPYFGRCFKGWPVMTMVRGTVVMKDGNILVKPGFGKYVPRPKKAVQ